MSDANNPRLRLTTDVNPGLRLIGLTLGVWAEDMGEWINYDIGLIAECALQALRPAVLAVEQLVTGTHHVHSLDIGDFYKYLGEALSVENGGEGVTSPGDDPGPVQDEIESLLKLVASARKIAVRAPEEDPPEEGEITN